MQAHPKLSRLPIIASFTSYESRWGVMLLSPWILGFAFLMLFPLGMTLYYSLLDFNGRSPQGSEFIGLGNYLRFFQDPNVAESLRTTLSFAALAVPARILIPLGLAALLTSRRLLGKPLLQMLFFLPSIIPEVAMTFTWAAFLTDSGWLNRLLLTPLGLPPLEWPAETPLTQYLLLTMMSLWGIGPSVLLLCAAMRKVPEDLYEAATVDGAGSRTQFFKITLPMISPTLLLIVLLTIVNAFNSVSSGLLGGVPWRTGGVGGYDTYINLVFFFGRDAGYAAALSWMLLLGMLVLAVILLATSRYWVHYQEPNR